MANFRSGDSLAHLSLFIIVTRAQGQVTTATGACGSINYPCRLTKLDNRLDSAAAPSGWQLAAQVSACSVLKLFDIIPSSCKTSFPADLSLALTGDDLASCARTILHSYISKNMSLAAK